MSNNQVSRQPSTQRATLPVPTGWKPSNKAELLTWLRNLEIQIGSAMNLIEGEEDQVKIRLYVAMQIVSRIEEVANR